MIKAGRIEEKIGGTMINHNLADFVFEYFTENNLKAGTLRYRYIKENVIDAYSTRVDDAFQGKGIAGELYNALIAFAQEKGWKSSQVVVILR